jgi:uncharacterized integral membrane protein
LPQCASSAYTTVAIGKVCNVPKCLNIASFNNNGTFTNSKVTINQCDPACVNIKSKTGDNPIGDPNCGGEGEPLSFMDKYKWYIIIGVIIIILLIIAVIIVIGIAYSHKIDEI